MEPIEIVKKLSNIEKFNPVQELALEKGLMKGINLVVSSPTASGKTIVSELFALNSILNALTLILKALFMLPYTYYQVSISSLLERFKFGKLILKWIIS